MPLRAIDLSFFYDFFLFEFETVLEVWYFLPFSRSWQICWQTKSEHVEKSTTLPEVTDKPYHVSLYLVHLVIDDEYDDRHWLHVDINVTDLK